jgi:hypothetical protein
MHMPWLRRHSIFSNFSILTTMDTISYLVLLLFHCSVLTFLLFSHIWTFYCSHFYIGRQCKWAVLYRTIPHLQVRLYDLYYLLMLIYRTIPHLQCVIVEGLIGYEPWCTVLKTSSTHAATTASPHERSVTYPVYTTPVCPSLPG